MFFYFYVEILEIASYGTTPDFKLSCYPTVTVREKANVTVCAFFGFSQLAGLGSQVGQITITLTFLVGVGGRLKMFALGRFRRSYATVSSVQFSTRICVRPLRQQTYRVKLTDQTVHFQDDYRNRKVMM